MSLFGERQKPKSLHGLRSPVSPITLLFWLSLLSPLVLRILGTLQARSCLNLCNDSSIRHCLQIFMSTSFTCSVPYSKATLPSLTTPQKTAASPISLPSLLPTYPAPLQCHLPHIYLNICLFSVDFQ